MTLKHVSISYYLSLSISYARFGVVSLYTERAVVVVPSARATTETSQSVFTRQTALKCALCVAGLPKIRKQEKSTHAPVCLIDR